jgi:hypothetical protein
MCASGTVTLIKSHVTTVFFSQFSDFFQDDE